MMKAKTLSWYKKKLDAVFSQYIRQRYAEPSGLVTCYTCGVRQHWKKMQCSHFVPRQYLSTRWDEANCQAACFACNMYYGGQPSVFASKLGAKKVKELEAKRTQIIKLTPQWYEDSIAYYQDKIK